VWKNAEKVATSRAMKLATFCNLYCPIRFHFHSKVN